MSLRISNWFTFYLFYVMAVPKKRTSKSKKNSRKARWKREALHESIKAMSLAKSSLTMKSNSYVYLFQEKVDEVN